MRRYVMVAMLVLLLAVPVSADVGRVHTLVGQVAGFT